MKRFAKIALLAIISLSVNIAPTAAAKIVPLNERVPLADPFIMLHEGTYYAYGTHSRHGIEVYTSKNLKIWHRKGLALHKRDSYGEKWFWAPEVYNINGKFYMFYSADKHICVATSTSPVGPFVQQEQLPILPDKGLIDNTIFIDDNGKAYMLYVAINKGFTIYTAELESDFMTIKSGTTSFCIKPSQRWERLEGRVNEGPSVIKRNGVYHLLYSGNGYTSQKYGVGCATATNIRGPWVKSPNNPILQCPGDLVGSGHGAPFYDKRGRLHYVFHAHRSHEKVHPRYMCIARASFKRIDGKEQFVISDRYRIPRRVK